MYRLHDRLQTFSLSLFSDLNWQHSQTKHSSYKSKRSCLQSCLHISQTVSEYLRLMAVIDGRSWLQRETDKQAQMEQVGCVCAHDLSMSLGQRRGPAPSVPNLPHTPTHPRHVKQEPHGRGVDHCLICLQGESGWPGCVPLSRASVWPRCHKQRGRAV